MKRFLCITFLGLLITGFAGISYASVDSVYEVAVVSFGGNVKVDTKGDGTWISPWVDMKLMEGAIIKTGDNSFVEIVFDADGLNIVKVGENSRVIVKKGSVGLPEGSILANFPNLTPGSSFTVKTPTAVCGVRGSGMGVDFLNNITVVMAFKDRVFVQGIDERGNFVGKEVIIPEGWKRRVGKGGIIEPPAELTGNEKIVWQAWIRAMARPTLDKIKEQAKKELEEEIDNKDIDDVKEISPSQ